MGISSLGVGSGILTQDVLDQLREADEGSQLTPTTLKIVNEKDKQKALEVLNASMDNFIDSINELKSKSLYDERKSEVTGSGSVEVTALANSDIQDFTLKVNTLATKQIEESGVFGSGSAVVGNVDGTFKLEVGSTSVNIDYTAGTTLDELKKLIQQEAGDLVDATVLQISPTESRLVLSSKETGAAQDIKISDVLGTLDANLTTNTSFDATGLVNDPDTSLPYAAIQAGEDSSFEFNGETISRSSNSIDDLITGYSIKLLKEDAVDELSNVSVSQDREGITSRVDSFIEKYNSTMTELNKLTKVSTGSDRGIFSSESTIRGMKSAITSVVGSVGEGVGSLYDYGIDVDKDGKMSIDKTVFNTKLDESASNVEAFFSGGTYDNGDGTTTELRGAFSDISTKVESYTKYNAILDQFDASIETQISAYEDRETSIREKLDSKYAILKKKFAAYDSLINKFNSSSDIFTQLANQNNN